VHYAELADEFLKDHRHVTRRLSRILRSLKQGEVEGAVEIAKELDTLAGPHIQFEEAVLYPEVARIRGRGYAQRLYREHRIGQTALRALLNEKQPLSEERLTELIQQFKVAVEHAASCGTLLSHLTELPDLRQREMLKMLNTFVEQGTPWTRLPPPPVVRNPEPDAPPE